MSNELALVSISDMERMALAIAKSGLFGLKTPDQALAMMLIAQANGQHPAAAARDYHVIQGTPAKKADAMLRDFQSSGGRVEWQAYTDSKCEATFTHPQGGSIRVDWTIERATKAGLTAKDTKMYAKYPRQMLRARCISEGIRTIWPAATGGMYVPEETAEFVPAEKHLGMAEEVDPATGEVRQPEPPKATIRTAAPVPPPPSPSGFDPAQAAEHEAQYLAMIAEATTDADVRRHVAAAKADWQPFGEAALPYYQRVLAAGSARRRVLKANLEAAASMTHGTAEKPATGPVAAAQGDWAAETAAEEQGA